MTENPVEQGGQMGWALAVECCVDSTRSREEKLGLRVVMNELSYYSPDYATSRQRFRDAASTAGWALESVPHELTGPSGEELAIDVAASPGRRGDSVVVVSSGLHGVEGLFGSAVQLALLNGFDEKASQTGHPSTSASGRFSLDASWSHSSRVICLHGLNPWGFAWRRRFDHQNIDPNRNFLLPGEEFAGCPAGYDELDNFLNPTRPPSRWEPFTMKAGVALCQHGMAKMKRAICGGQFDYPHGLWFGGHQPGWTHRTLLEHLPHWLEGATRVVHLDFHTGLGKSGTWKLLVDFELSSSQRRWLTETYGKENFEANDDAQTAYPVRGGFGLWCQHHFPDVDYLYLCAEFGTFSPLTNLGGLRAENQTTHWCEAGDPRISASRARLQYLFVPASQRWRTSVLRDGLQLIERALG